MLHSRFAMYEEEETVGAKNMPEKEKRRHGRKEMGRWWRRSK